MTPFWSWYVTILSLGTIFAIAWIIFGVRKGQRQDPTDETVGHAFDGIEEYDNPLPKWWFMLFIATIIFALGYLVLYPGLGNWKGVLPGYDYVDSEKKTTFDQGVQIADGEVRLAGWTGVHQWEKEMARANEQYGPLYAKFAAMPIEEVAKDPQALKMGSRLFASNCAVCHGSDAGGSYGFPNLADNEWRWPSTPAEIKNSILNGRNGMMPAQGPVIGEDGVRNVAAYVMTELMDRKLPEGTTADIEAGKKIFATTCFICHGAEGQGNPMMGAPNLTKPSAFIYGTSYAQLQQTIRYGRVGKMPAHADFLGNDKVHLLAAYVYSLSHKAE